MRPTPITEKDSATGVTITSPFRVVKVVALPEYRIEVEFVDGVRGIVDLSERVKSQNAGVFSALADIALFDQVEVKLGVVTWPGDIDLAPDVMHDEISKNGHWRLPA